MVRFASPNDDGFVTLTGRLSMWIDELAERADELGLSAGERAT
jgi:hypothetical protein